MRTPAGSQIEHVRGDRCFGAGDAQLASAAVGDGEQAADPAGDGILRHRRVRELSELLQRHLAVVDPQPARGDQMGRRVAADYEVTAFEPDKRLEFRTVAGPVRPHGRYDLEEVEGGTRLTFSLDAELSGLRKLLMGSMVQKTMDAEVSALDDLKRVLEA